MLLSNRYIVVLLCICLIVIVGCEREEEIPSSKPPPIQEFETFSTQHREEGVLKWTLVGESSEVRREKVVVQNPKVQIFKEGQLSITLTSKTGQLFRIGKKKDNLYLKGEVVGVNEKGTLYTEELQWQNKDGMLYSPTEVKIVRGDSTWYGTEMVANPDLESVKMSKNRFTLYPKDEEIND